jgi:hypothetical protein
VSTSSLVDTKQVLASSLVVEIRPRARDGRSALEFGARRVSERWPPGRTAKVELQGFTREPPRTR